MKYEKPRLITLSGFDEQPEPDAKSVLSHHTPASPTAIYLRLA